MITGWVAHMVADQELRLGGGKSSRQRESPGHGVLAHDLRLCLAQWAASEKRYEPGACAGATGPIERYPGLRLLTMDALYAERGLCRCTWCGSKGIRAPDGFAGEEPGEPQAETLEKRRARVSGPSAAGTTSGMSWDSPGRGTWLEKEHHIATGEVSRERYLLTSLSSRQWGPRELLRLFRNHWSVENRHHGSWDEDVCAVPGWGRTPG